MFAGAALVVALAGLVISAGRDAARTPPALAASAQQNGASPTDIARVALPFGSVAAGKLQIVRAINREALALGLDPAVETAIALIETGGTLDPETRGDARPADPKAVGGFCSFGLFQLNHCSGEGRTHTVRELTDIATNITLALRGHAAVIASGRFPDALTAIVQGFQRPEAQSVEAYLAAASPGGGRYEEALDLLVQALSSPDSGPEAVLAPRRGS